MPFNGIPNAGAPDPQWFSMLLQARQNRAQLEIEQAKAQAAQMAAMRKEERLDAKHRMEMAKSAIDLINALKQQEEQLGAAQTSASTTKDQAAQAYPVSDYAQMAVNEPGDLPAGIFPSQNIPDYTNAPFQNQIQESVDAPVNARLAAIASSIQGIPGFENYAMTLPGQGVSTELTRDRLNQETLQTKLAEEARASAESDRKSRRDFQESETAARNQEARLRARGVETIKVRERELQRLSNMIEGGKLQGDDLELAQNEYRAIQAERDADLTANQDASVVTERRRRAQDNLEYDHMYDMNRNIQGIIQRVETGDTSEVGLKGFFSGFAGNLASMVEETTGRPFADAYMDTWRAVSENPANSDEEIQKIQEQYFNQDVLDRVASGNISELEARWMLMYSLNPDGRVSNLLSQETGKLTNWIGPGVGPKTALSRLRAIDARQKGLMRRKRSFIKQVNESEAFSTDGRRVASESLPMPIPTKPGGSPQPNGNGLMTPALRRSMQQDLLSGGSTN